MASDDLIKGEVHRDNPDVRPKEQNIKRKQDEFSTTPPVPRSFKTGFGQAFLKDYHKGVMGYTYKGITCLKSPIDLAIYMMVIWDKKPGTIIEIGSFQGGAAQFYYDLTRNYGLETDIITVDFREIQDERDSNNPV
ncbi:MAG: CmcI family methyltransferase, partial [Mangrovicoccus sp.]